jgi:hypothetical protein
VADLSWNFNVLDAALNGFNRMAVAPLFLHQNDGVKKQCFLLTTFLYRAQMVILHEQLAGLQYSQEVDGWHVMCQLQAKK